MGEEPPARPRPPSIRTRRGRPEQTEEYLQRKEILLGRAAELFHSKGLAETSVADIALSAGMDRAAVYYYFANKEEMVVEVLQRALQRSAVEIERVARLRVPPDVKLHKLIVTLMQLFDEHYPHMYVYVKQDVDSLEALPIPQEKKAWLVEQSYRSAAIWRKVIEDGIKAGVFRRDVPVGIVTATILGAVSWSSSWYRPDGPLPAEQVGEALAALLVDGLRLRSGR